MISDTESMKRKRTRVMFPIDIEQKVSGMSNKTMPRAWPGSSEKHEEKIKLRITIQNGYGDIIHSSAGLKPMRLELEQIRRFRPFPVRYPNPQRIRR